MDLLTYDGVGGTTLSKGGALVTIDSTKGCVTYSIDSSSDFYDVLQGLGVGKSYCDTFVYAIKNSNGTLSQGRLRFHRGKREDGPGSTIWYRSLMARPMRSAR